MNLYNLFLILFNIFYISCDFNYVSAVATSDIPTNETNDIVISYENECRALCENCDCKGFFCGDNECICECNANIDELPKYAQCLKDTIKGKFYNYNISVQHLNVSTVENKKSKLSKKRQNNSKTIKKRSVAWEMHPEGTNLEKERIFKAESDFKLPTLNLDFLKLPNLGIAKITDLAPAPKPSLLGAPKPSLLAAPMPPLSVAPSSDSPPAAVSTQNEIKTDTSVGSPSSATVTNENNVGLAGKLAGLFGKIKGKSLGVAKVGVLGDGVAGAPQTV